MELLVAGPNFHFIIIWSIVQKKTNIFFIVELTKIRSIFGGYYKLQKLHL